MNAHIPTMSMAIVLVGIVLSLSVGLVADRAQRDGMLYWSAGLVMHTAAYVFFNQRAQIGDFASIILANVCLSCSLAAFSEGIYEFYRHPPPRSLIWAPVLVVLLALVVLMDSLAGRIVVSSAIYFSQALLAVSLVWQKRGQTAGRGKYFLASGLAIVMTMVALRAIGAMRGAGAAMTSLTESNPIQTMTLAAALVCLILLSLGFVLMSKERADELNRVLASRDELTGLANRRRLNETLASEWARATRSDQPLALVLLDIDLFKNYNDAYGHQAGDECLKRVAQCLESGAQRAGDLAARYGGEEFLLILPDTDALAARGVAEAVRRAVEAMDLPHKVAASGRVTVSIGVAALTGACYPDAESLLRAADEALYRAKNDGRNQVQLAEQALQHARADEAVTLKLVQLVWRGDYESGNKVIDEQHRKLFSQSNKLLGAVLGGQPTQEVAALVDQFIADVLAHFQAEEAIIAAAGFADAPDHALQHRVLVDKALALAERYRAGALSVGELFEFLAYDVVARHILAADRAYFSCLASRADAPRRDREDAARQSAQAPRNPAA